MPFSNIYWSIRVEFVNPSFSPLSMIGLKYDECLLCVCVCWRTFKVTSSKACICVCYRRIPSVFFKLISGHIAIGCYVQTVLLKKSLHGFLHFAKSLIC